MIDEIVCGDALSILQSMPSESINCCITSPPYYGLRDYGIDGQIGLEQTPEEYVARLVEVFREVRRVLKPEGTLWLNLGSSYINKTIESDEMVLRDNLTIEEREYVFKEILEHVKTL